MASCDLSSNATDVRARYDRTVDPSGNDSLARIARRICPGSCVLDLGASTGALGVYLASHKQCVMDGVEFDPLRAEIGAAAYRVMHVGDLESERLIDHFPPATYDYIVCADVLEHLRDPGRLLDQLHELLKPGGCLLLSVPNIGHVGVIAELLAGEFRYREDGLLDETHLRFFTRRSFLRLLDRHRFSVAHLEAIEKDVLETEFRDRYLDVLPESVFRSLLSQPDAVAYQFVMEAVPGKGHTIDVDTEQVARRSLRFGCQLFWRAEGEEFTADQSSVGSGVIGEGRQVIALRIPPLVPPPVSLRLDPAERPGILHLHGIRLYDENGAVLWEWDANLRSISACPHHQIVFLYQSNVLLLVGEDPHVVLPIPSEQLVLLGNGGTLEVEVGWPLSAGLPEAATISVDEHEALSQTIEIELDQARAECERLRNELNDTKVSMERLRSERDEALNSLSWRATAILRFSARAMFAFYRKCRVGARRLYVASVLREANPPEGALGFLESPDANGRVEKAIAVSGWLLFKNAAVKSMWMTLDDSVMAPVTYGYSRADVAQALPDLPQAKASGFTGLCSLPAAGRKRGLLTVWAELETGIRVKCFSRRVHIHSPKVVNSRFILDFFSTSASKLWRAFRERRLPLSPARWFGALYRNYELLRAYRQQSYTTSALVPGGFAIDPYDQWIESNRLTPKIVARMRADAARVAAAGPKISVVVPVFNTPAPFLGEMIESVMTQIYPNWELCLADDASTEPHVRKQLERAKSQDARVKVVFRDKNGHIVEATNSAIDLASGDYIAFLDHDDVLTQDALLQVAECVERDPAVDWIYTDEDKIDQDGRRYDPQFKGAWSPEMAITHNYTHHLSVIRRSLVLRAGRMRAGFEGAQDLDLFLRVAELTKAERIRHVPKICYHWRAHLESTASRGTQKNYVFASARRAIKDALARRGLMAEPALPSIAEERGLCLYQLKWSHQPSSHQVTIVIPTRDRVDLLQRCVESLQRTVDPKIARLIIVDDHSSDATTRDFFSKLQRERILNCRVIASPGPDRGFNYSRLVNSAIPHITTPYLLHLNNDIEALQSGWLEDMLGWMSIPDVGVVGARLLYPDGRVQHAGVLVGPYGGLADHQFRNLPANEVGYLALVHAARNVSAVTGACMLTRTDVYKKLGGFDGERLGVEYNDVDYCLRVAQEGWRVVYSPQATLMHVSSASRGSDYKPEEHINFLRKYGAYRDPYVNENLVRDSTLMVVDGARFNHADRVSGLNILLISHDLFLAGAPIVAYEFARHFVSQGCRVSLVSPMDGPLRERYEELGVPIRILDRFPVMHRATLAEVRDYLRSLGNELRMDSFDLLISNTLTGFWGIELARLFGVPSIWHIHESMSTNVYGVQVERSTRSLVRSAFVNANRVVFQAEATRRLFMDVKARDNFLLIPGGIPIDRIDAFRASHTKDALRSKYGIDRDAVVVTLPGTTCERKGQHVFLDAIRQLRAKRTETSSRKVVFVLVGARPSPYLNLLKEQIVELGVDEDVRLFEETKDIYDFYGLSDIFVCASFVESFPMVVLLAMAFNLPIVTTDVFGIPEIVSGGHDALFVKPGDAAGLADAIEIFLDDTARASLFAARAHAKARRLFASDNLLARHLMLIKQVAMEDCAGAEIEAAVEPSIREYA